MTVEDIARAGYEAWSGERWAERPSSAVEVVWMELARQVDDDIIAICGDVIHRLYWRYHLVDAELIRPMWEGIDPNDRRWHRAAAMMVHTARGHLFRATAA